jgi:hypothetical protein
VTKSKRDLNSSVFFPPGAERVLMINVSARLRAFYDAMAEVVSKERGYPVTRQDILRELHHPSSKPRKGKSS